MLEKPFSGITLTLLLIGMLTLAFNIQPVKAETLQLELTTDKDVYALGENVTITLLNKGNETVEIGGYPAWQIFTYPEEEPVYPENFAYLAWSLDPGENDTLTWNQFNEFKQSYVESGTYIIRDTQGWGLTTYFKIVAAEIIIPDDYPTIQTGINSASPRDTIYVRWGEYRESVVVNKTVALIGEKISFPPAYPIIVGVISIYANNVSITRLITNPAWFPCSGVYAKNVSNCKISEMIIHVDEGYGIWLNSSSNNVLAYNTFRGLVWDGIRLEYSSNNTIIGNNVTMDWVDYGIWLTHSSGNVLARNNIANAHTGIRLSKSFNNKIYHNNFFDMRITAVDSHESTNVWDDGCEGNYWSDYDGVDTDGDGIGDTPYVIDADNHDNYPLMFRWWNRGDINSDGTVNIIDITIAALAFGSTPGDENWNCRADITRNQQVNIIDIAGIALEFRESY